MQICVINGHPDPAPSHLAAALAAAYAEAAGGAGHTVSRIAVGDVPLTFLANSEEFAQPPDPAVLAEREKIAAADHVVIVYPLWLGTMPARLKAFLEHTARGNFLLDATNSDQKWPVQKMEGKSARVMVTMGMPGIIYRVWYGAQSLRSLERMILKMSGFGPVHSTIFGAVGTSDAARQKMLAKAAALGAKGA